jgi:hypothetical protein
MAYPKYSILLTVAVADGAVTTTDYTVKSTADAAYVAAVDSGDYNFVSLFLEQLPSKSFEAVTATGTWTDAYGVVRVVPTGVPD